MRMYLTAKTKQNINYIPDYLEVEYKNRQDEVIHLRLDINGETEYDQKNALDIRTKGTMTLYLEENMTTGKIIDLYELDEAEQNKRYPTDILISILRCSKTHKIGLYPAPSSLDDETLRKKVNSDVFENCEAVLSLQTENKAYTIPFTFQPETYM